MADINHHSEIDQKQQPEQIPNNLNLVSLYQDSPHYLPERPAANGSDARDFLDFNLPIPGYPSFQSNDAKPSTGPTDAARPDASASKPDAPSTSPDAGAGQPKADNALYFGEGPYTQQRLDAVSQYEKANANTNVDFSKLIPADSRLVTAADATHPGLTTQDSANELEKMAVNLKNANPPLSQVAFEGIPKEANSDFKTWYDYYNGNPNNISKQTADDAKQKALDSTNDGWLPTELNVVKPMLTNLVEKDHILPQGIEPLPGTTVNTFHFMQDSPDKPAFDNLLKQYGQNGLSDDQRQQYANQIQDFLSKETFQPNSDPNIDGQGKLTQNGLTSVTQSLAQLRQNGFDFQSDANLDERTANVRSQMIANDLDTALKNDPNSRILVSIGDGHTGYNTTWSDGYPNLTLNEASKNKSTMINFGNDNLVGKTPAEKQLFNSADATNLYADAAQQAGLNNKEFAVPYAADPSNPNGIRPFDYYIEIPPIDLGK